MFFRKANIEDISDVLNLYRRGVESMHRAGIDQWDEEYPSEEIIRKDILNSHLYVCVCDDETAAVFVLDKEVDAEYAEARFKNPDAEFIAMHRLCVSPNFHRKGLGCACMQEIFRIARECGYTSVRLDTFSGNFKALAMYEKLGFKEVGEAHWRKGRFIIFEKTL